MGPRPPTTQNTYNETKEGYYGEFGSGDNVKIKFLQTAMSPDELKMVTLIQSIRGSEKWPVRDLFQRDVDKARVTNDILPYMQDTGRVKFFNPLTLVLMPVVPGEDAIQSDLRPATENETDEYNEFEVAERFKFKQFKDTPAYSQVTWNSRNVKLVAIDGQHRLSALKRWADQPRGLDDLRDWSIPVVILGITQDPSAPQGEGQTVLDVMRKTFMYINTQAVQVNEARSILLDDESINKMCVQEIIEESHSNDNRPLLERDRTCIPLVFFDWRGQTTGASPAALETTVEIESWMSEYLLGEDGGDLQASRLELEDQIGIETPMDRLDRIVSQKDAKKIKSQFRELMYPGISYLLQNFAPFKSYTEAVRRLENEHFVEAADVGQHAWSEIRFGDQSTDDPGLAKDISLKKASIATELQDAQYDINLLIRRDVGTRAVISAFSWLMKLKEDKDENTPSWLEFSKWFVPRINSVYQDGWFKAYDRQTKPHLKLMTHIVFDTAENLTNVKLRQVDRGFGKMIGLLVLSADPAANEDLETAWDSSEDSMRTLLRSGYKREVKAELRDEPFEGQNEHNKAVNAEAESRAEKHLTDFMKYLNVYQA